MDMSLGGGPLIIRGTEAIVSNMDRGSDAAQAIEIAGGVLAGALDPIGTTIYVVRETLRNNG